MPSVKPTSWARIAGVGLVAVAAFVACTGVERPAFERRVLPNGVTILVRENRSSHIVSLQFWVRDGALFETRDEIGAAHLLESMLLGSPAADSSGTVRAIDALGGTVETHGRHDFVRYAATVPSEHFGRALELLSHGLFAATFDQRAFEGAKEVVAASLSRSERRPIDLAYRMCLREMMGDHPYGRPPEGTPDALASRTLSDVETRYRERYTGSNIVVSVAGDVDPAAAAARIEALLAPLAAGTPAEPAAEPVSWPAESRRVVARSKARRAYQVLAFPGPGALDGHNVTMDIILAAAGRGRSSRLSRILKDERGLVDAIGAGWYTMRQPSPLFVWMELAADNVAAAEAGVVEVLQALGDEPLDEEELTEAKRKMEAAVLFLTETSEGQAFDSGYWASVGGEDLGERYLEKLWDVTADDVMEAARTYFGSGIHVAAVVLPE